MLIAIIPAYNEEKNLGSVVRSLLNLPSSSKDYAGQLVDRVVVVDDGSLDKSGEIARDAGAVLLNHKINRGQGAALQTGHDYALAEGADYVLHFDADGQFDAGDIVPAFNALKESGADILFGSRFLGKESNIPFVKKYILFPFARVFNKYFTGIKLTDIHNGFRILNRKALLNIEIKQDRMAHATEIIGIVRQKGLKYIEFPVKVVYRTYGQGVEGGIRILKDLFVGMFVRK
ncbi:MAG: glycosyltransferase family 2 protein [bacterium]|nr:glycosyltransferase family 2 protein [bacterium]